jgi:hypothetical protein
MRLFFPDFDTLHRFTLELDRHQEALTCHHCARRGQLVSHGFVYRKQHNADKQPVAKRIFCSNRHGKTGCGRTRRLRHLLSTFKPLFSLPDFSHPRQFQLVLQQPFL